MKAIILAAGLGTRLKPITDNTPKPWLKLAGKYIVQRTIEHLLHLGFSMSDIALVVQKTPVFDFFVTQLKQSLHTTELKTLIQDEQLGTGHATLVAADFVGDHDFLVLNGDIVFSEHDLKALIDIAESPVTAGILMYSNVSDFQNYGVLFHDNEKITALIEKPETISKDQKWGINAGAYFFKSGFMDVLKKLKLSSRNEYELTDGIIQLLESGAVVKPVLISDYWFDVGKPWDLLNANKVIMDQESKMYEVLGEVEKGATLLGSVMVEEGARIRSGVYIEGPVFISKNCDIGPNCYIRSYTFLDESVRVGNACEVKGSIIYKGTHVAHLSYVGDSIVGKKSNFGAGAITANLRHDDAPVKVTIKGKRISSGRRKLGAIIGDHVKLGIGVSILPGVKIGSNAWIASGAIIERDVPNNALVIVKQEKEMFQK